VSPLRSSPPAVVPPVPPPLLPGLRQGVRVTLPGEERYGARVIEITEQEITLVLTVDARAPLKRGDVAEMALEFAAPRGIVRLDGHGTVVARDLVRFSLDGEAAVLQRRDYVRVEAVRPMAVARVEADGEPGAWIDTLTANLSGNGVLAAGPDTLEIGDAVHLRLALVEGEPPIVGEGRVVRIADDGRRAIAIEQMDGDGRRRLVRFIFDCERIARQRVRDSER
jgi:PilZ domain-containing protein